MFRYYSKLVKCVDLNYLKILVLCENYPSTANPTVMAFIHTRNVAYKQHRVQVDVLAFQVKEAYVYEGVPVYTAKHFSELITSNKYNVVVCHAPNLRNHLRAIIPNIRILPKIVFVFHGHEILRTSRYYPAAYPFNRGRFYALKKFARDIYDLIKCQVLNFIIKKYGGQKISLIFVSNYLRELFTHNVGLQESEIARFSTVIPNPSSEYFMCDKYDWNSKKKADFIIIRTFDGPKYCIDYVLGIAKAIPKYTFHIYGDGRYFEYNPTPNNVTVFKGFLKQSEVPNLLNQYRAALMPSKWDSQGVMATEMACFGIPLIASKIPAAMEMLSEFPNVLLIEDDKTEIDLDSFLKNIKPQDNSLAKARFSAENTAKRELEWFK